MGRDRAGQLRLLGGLVQAAWASARVSVPRVTHGQRAALPHIAQSALQPGDLLFYDG